MDVIMLDECMCTHVHIDDTYMYTYVRVHLHIIPPISPPQVDYGPAKSYAVLLENPTEVRRGAGDDNL